MISSILVLYPAWSLYAFGGLLVAFSVSQYYENFVMKESKSKAQPSGKKQAEFRQFQFQYLLVYLITMFADWLQGTHMYNLYQSYDETWFHTLFMTGFCTSAIFSFFIGSWVDKYGRKNSCVLFCVLEIIINSLEHFNNLPLLLVGRVLGGISTCLLFSSFESWMVSEHRKRGFPEELLSETFAIAGVGNGIVAVFAGVTAQAAADYTGKEIAPFQLAIALTVVALVLTLSWPENYGQDQNKDSDWIGTLAEGWQQIRHNRAVSTLGLICALFEGSMFTFVSMWVPKMFEVCPGGAKNVPVGIVFSCFMMCISIGGTLFAVVNRSVPVVTSSIFVYFVASISMIVPAYTSSFFAVFFAFMVFETCCGVFFPASGTLRSMYLPGTCLSTIMNIFRIPLNILVVTGTTLKDNFGFTLTFQVLASWLFLAFVCQLYLSSLEQPKSKQQSKPKTSTKKKSENTDLPTLTRRRSPRLSKKVD